MNAKGGNETEKAPELKPVLKVVVLLLRTIPFPSLTSFPSIRAVPFTPRFVCTSTLPFTFSF